MRRLRYQCLYSPKLQPHRLGRNLRLEAPGKFVQGIGSVLVLRPVPDLHCLNDKETANSGWFPPVRHSENLLPRDKLPKADEGLQRELQGSSACGRELQRDSKSVPEPNSRISDRNHFELT